jgi:hypothetical protein
MVPQNRPSSSSFVLDFLWGVGHSRVSQKIENEDEHENEDDAPMSHQQR